MDREEKMAFMRSRGHLNEITSIFMVCYAGSRDDHPKEKFPDEWQWLWDISDVQRADLLKSILEIFLVSRSGANTASDFETTKSMIRQLHQLFSTTQMLSGLRPNALGA